MVVSIKQKQERRTKRVYNQKNEPRVAKNWKRRQPEGNQPFTSLQRTIGNQAVQRLIKERIQPKLKVGKPDDKYEREADRVANQVMRMSEPGLKQPSIKRRTTHHRAQRLCPRCQERFQRGKPLNCSDCEQELQRAETVSEAPSLNANKQRQVQAGRSGGRPLPASVRSFFEPRFGRDFGDVRIHTNSRADAAARAIHARAFTLGSDMVFRSSNYQPDTDNGMRLLAHELTHVVQQRGGKDTAISPTSAESDRATSIERPSVRAHTDSLSDVIQRACTAQGWEFEYDGCSVPPKYRKYVSNKDNPTGRRDTTFAVGREGTGLPCDVHDECYQTCASELTIDGWNYDMQHKARCEEAFLNRMLEVCEAAGDPEGTESLLGWNPNCSTYAQVYYRAVKHLGGDAFRERQREVCTCEKMIAPTTSVTESVTEETTGKNEAAGIIETASESLTGAAEATASRLYVVQPGDNLSTIAEKLGIPGGRRTGWKLLYQLNKDRIDNPNLIFPGQTILLPN